MGINAEKGKLIKGILDFAHIDCDADALISGYNTFEDIQEWTEKKLGEIWIDAIHEEWETGNYSWSSAYKIAIEKLIERWKERTR